MTCTEEQFQAELQRLASISKYDLKAFKDAMDVRIIVMVKRHCIAGVLN